MGSDSRLDEILRISNLVAETRDQDLLLERILSEARRFCNADAGSIYLCERKVLHLKYSQNDNLFRRSNKKAAYPSFSRLVDSSTISGYVAETGETLSIDDVYALDPNLPYQFGKEYDLMNDYRTQSMLTVPLKNGRQTVVGVLQLINAHDPDGKVIPFPESEFPLVRHLANQAAVALEKAELTRAIILRMIRMAEMRDPKETGPHVNRVGAFSAELWEAWAKKHGVPDEEMEQKKDLLRVAAMLHDVGKVAISDLILKKPAKLTDEEYAVMKTHTYLGANLFFDKQSDIDDASAEIALTHHENWNGHGYPGYINAVTGEPTGISLKGENIPLYGRIVKIADVYDALSRPRVYKEAWTQEKVINELIRCRGTDFDPELLDLFIDNIEIIQSISARFPDDE
jgi:HD-GYP domain-containing protein (c-di-GMP phosphodiesterase class II)